MREKTPFMPLYGREFFSDEHVIVLTLTQEACYLRLIWLCWQEGSIPADTAMLAAMCKNMPSGKFKREVWPALVNLFAVRSDGRLTHQKVEALRAAKERFREQCSEAGKRGNEKRWGADRVPDSDPIETESQPDANPNRVSSLSDFRLPNTDCRLANCDNQTQNHTCASSDARVDGLGERLPNKPKKGDLTPEQQEWFAEWWRIFWRKKDRKNATKAFAIHVRRRERFDEVMSATKAQLPEMSAKEPEHRPYGSTWLRAERWQDEVEPVGSVSRGNVRPDAITAAVASLYEEVPNDQ